MRFFHGYFRAGLHRRLFFWFGASILLSGLVVTLVMGFVGGMAEPIWRRDLGGALSLAAGRFERVWDVPAERDELARSVARELRVDLVLKDAGDRTLAAYGRPCWRPAFSIPVLRDGAPLGTVRVCVERHRLHGPWRLALPLVLAGAMLWAAAGAIARRLTRPLWEISRVAQDIGSGKLSSRAPLRWRDGGEVRVLAASINDMADRIERQMADQRVLLAAVSHELRTPLTRIRLLLELVRENGSDEKTLDELEREVVEIDRLVGELLASSRLDFAAFTPRRLDAVEVARRALDRAGADPGALAVETNQVQFEGDATLIARALANLIDNAERHGGGLKSLRVTSRPGFVGFEAEDSGPGFAAGEEERVFQPFYRRAPGASADAGSLGLGLTLVRRIAEAHGGSARAGNRAGGGARVGFEVAVSGVRARAETKASPSGAEPEQPRPA